MPSRNVPTAIWPRFLKNWKTVGSSCRIRIGRKRRKATSTVSATFTLSFILILFRKTMGMMRISGQTELIPPCIVRGRDSRLNFCVWTASLRSKLLWAYPLWLPVSVHGEAKMSPERDRRLICWLTVATGWLTSAKQSSLRAYIQLPKATNRNWRIKLKFSAMQPRQTSPSILWWWQHSVCLTIPTPHLCRTRLLSTTCSCIELE